MSFWVNYVVAAGFAIGAFIFWSAGVYTSGWIYVVACVINFFIAEYLRTKKRGP